MVPYNLCSSLLLLKARAIAKRHKETMVPRFRSVPGTILAGVLWTSPFLHQPMSPSGLVRGGGETGVDRTVRSDSSRAGQDLFCAAFHASPSLDVLINSGDCFRVFFWCAEWFCCWCVVLVLEASVGKPRRKPYIGFVTSQIRSHLFLACCDQEIQNHPLANEASAPE